MIQLMMILLLAAPPVQAEKPKTPPPPPAPEEKFEPVVEHGLLPVVAPRPIQKIDYQIKKRDIYIIVDDRDYRTISLKQEMSVDWTKRLNPKAIENWSPQRKAKVMARMRRLNERQAYIKKHFNFHWIDYLKVSGNYDSPMMRFGKYRSWQKLPADMIMCEGTLWTGFFEWLADYWNYPWYVDQWETECWKLRKRNDAINKERRLAFQKEYVKKHPEFIISGSDWGLYIETGEHYEGYQRWYSLYSLGFKEEVVVMPEKPPEPKQCPVKGWKLE